jgi:hypothetical protein
MLKMILGVTMITGLLMNNIQAKEVSNTGDNVLKAGKIVAIEYSENPNSMHWKESLDKMYIEVDGYTYLYYDFAEDMFVDDDVLVIMNTHGTETPKDDFIRSYRYWVPEYEDAEWYNMVENGTCIEK